MKTVLLVRFGEIFLKGQNRSFFMSTLARNIRVAIAQYDAKLVGAEGRYFVEGEPIGEIAERVRGVFGVHSVSPAVECEKDMAAIETAAVDMMLPLSGTFKVVARRSDKRFPVDSMGLNSLVGGYVLDAVPALKVDVHNPMHILEVEIREKAYLHVLKLPGAGGMPVGTGGRAALLLSGGIDSPVAGYRIARRGVVLDCVHFHSFPFTSEQAKEKVVDLARILTRSCGPIRLHIVPFTEIQQELHEQCPDSQLTILMRRHMMRIAERIALRNGCGALVTGESLGQVASQTMASIRCTNEVCSLPVFRPLIGYDKQDIIEQALKIGTYETSILPYEDCCTIFTPRHPNTRPKPEAIRESEMVFDYEPMIQRAVEGVELVKLTPTT